MRDYEFEENEVNIGNLGETKLTEWCDAARLTSNESLHEDKMGWDHLIEFPYFKSSKPKDNQPKPIECKVQVKSTFREDGGVQIKLSALKRLVDYTSPAFILFFEFKDKESPRLDRAYLVHVDERLIALILKRVRQEHISNTPQPLNKIKLRVSYSDEDRLDVNDGFALRDRIASFVPDGMFEYQKHKNELTKTIGYDERAFIFQFNAHSEKISKHLLEAAIGLPTQLEIKNSILKDNRFDLPNGAVEIENLEFSKISVQPDIIDDCQLRFKKSKHSTALIFSGQILRMPQLTTNKNSLYFRTKLFSLELVDISQGSADGSLHFTIENQVPIDEAVRFFKLFSEESKGETLFFEAELQSKKDPIKARVTLNHEFEDASALVKSIRFLKDSFDIDGNSLCTLDELYERRHSFEALVAIIQNKVDNIVFRDESCDEFSNGPEAKVAYTMVVPIGDAHFGAVAILHGKRDSDYKYKVYNAEVIETISVYDEPKAELFTEIQNNALKRYVDSSDP